MQHTDKRWLEAQLEVVRQTARAQGRSDVMFVVTNLPPDVAQRVLGAFGAAADGVPDTLCSRRRDGRQDDPAGMVMSGAAGVGSGDTVVALMIAPTGLELDGG